uniref:CSON002186 protein n=1 Tax=Culicoides sonorensis TaxID=179676 RepID=A0A336MMB2_CULSO
MISGPDPDSFDHKVHAGFGTNGFHIEGMDMNTFNKLIENIKCPKSESIDRSVSTPNLSRPVTCIDQLLDGAIKEEPTDEISEDESPAQNTNLTRSSSMKADVQPKRYTSMDLKPAVLTPKPKILPKKPEVLVKPKITKKPELAVKPKPRINQKPHMVNEDDIKKPIKSNNVPPPPPPLVPLDIEGEQKGPGTKMPTITKKSNTSAPVNLLAEIQKGTLLKKVDQNSMKKPTVSNDIRSVLIKRIGAIQGIGDQESDEEDKTYFGPGDCSHLSDEEKFLVLRNLRSTMEITCMTIAQIYTCERFMKKFVHLTTGVLYLAKKEKIFSIGLFHLVQMLIQWEEEVYQEMTLTEINSKALCFEAKRNMVLLNFAFEDDMALFLHEFIQLKTEMENPDYGYYTMFTETCGEKKPVKYKFPKISLPLTKMSSKKNNIRSISNPNIETFKHEVHATSKGTSFIIEGMDMHVFDELINKTGVESEIIHKEQISKTYSEDLKMDRCVSTPEIPSRKCSETLPAPKIKYSYYERINKHLKPNRNKSDPQIPSLISENGPNLPFLPPKPKIVQSKPNLLESPKMSPKTKPKVYPKPLKGPQPNEDQNSLKNLEKKLEQDLQNLRQLIAPPPPPPKLSIPAQENETSRATGQTDLLAEIRLGPNRLKNVNKNLPLTKPNTSSDIAESGIGSALRSALEKRSLGIQGNNDSESDEEDKTYFSRCEWK